MAKRMIQTVLLTTAVVAGQAWAGHESRDQGGSVEGAVGAVIGAMAEGLFDSRDRAVLTGYLGGSEGYGDGGKGSAKKAKSLPPGLRKKLERGGELPPGWQAKVARGEVIDMDLYRHAQSLPEDILARLGRGPAGTSVRQIDDRIVRVADATRTVLDVFYLGAGHY